ncbi:MAG: HD domain-containing protein [Gemmatimonadetes bacterium]|nr:HD domain-containing protein [Gemmatimonadota bacterium]
MNTLVDPSLAKDLAQGTPAQKVDALFAYMERRGQSFYDEIVTQLEHALQCAHQAQQAGADSVQVAAALLHDLGHFLVDEHNQEADFLTEDLLHEEVGAEYLEPFFIDAVTEPVGLHVPAKRYICTVDKSYYQTLSRASKRSFELQGGFMSAEEKAAFEQNLHWESAVQLRKWDDLAKVKDLKTPGLESYRAAVQGCLK